MGILERSEYRTLFLAFNKSIQEEIQAKIEERGFQHAKAMTIHSLGLSAIRNTFGTKRTSRRIKQTKTNKKQNRRRNKS